MITVLIADNQALTREGLKSVLAHIVDIQVVAEANHSMQLQSLVGRVKPVLLIIDPFYSPQLTTEDIKDIRARFSSLHILVLSNHQSKADILKIIDVPVRNYVFKECSREELIHAIYTTANGKQFFCKHTFETLFGSKLIADKPLGTAALSARETELIHLIAGGLTNKEIAEKLFLSIHTVKTHRKNIIKKLGFTFKNIADIAAVLQTKE